MINDKRTPEEWAALHGVRVANPDGWRSPFRTIHRDYIEQAWDVPITRQEWEDRLGVSTAEYAVDGTPFTMTKSAQDPTFEMEETAARLAREKDISYAEALHELTSGIKPTKAVQKWADTAMFASEPLDATTGPSVHLLSMNPDPLGEIAAACLMYQGVVVKDLADITDEQRRKAFEQIKATKLKAPFEFVKMHFLLEGVTRSFTHQMVRQRTAVYAQESLRFAVVGEEFTSRVALPPSLAETRSYESWAEEAQIALGLDRIVPEEDIQEWVERHASARDKARFQWDEAVRVVGLSYHMLVNNGIPAEDARGLLPHNITTRLHYATDLRALVDHAGNRLCTQAQFEWRTVFVKLVQAIRKFPYTNGVPHVYNVYVDDPHHGRYRAARESAWQFDLIADLFRPACYLTGKCEFAAQDLDRKCKIRPRVDANHDAGRSPETWGEEYDVVAERGYNPLVAEMGPQGVVRAPDRRPVFIGAIHPREWLADPGAAR